MEEKVLNTMRERLLALIESSKNDTDKSEDYKKGEIDALYGCINMIDISLLLMK